MFGGKPRVPKHGVNQAEPEGLKPQKTFDEVFNERLSPFLNLMEDKINEIYADFNLALANVSQDIRSTENEVSSMVKVLWGIVNETNARLAALESVLIKEGLNPESVSEELKQIKDKMGMTEVTLKDLMDTTLGAGARGNKPPSNSPIAPAGGPPPL